MFHRSTYFVRRRMVRRGRFTTSHWVLKVPANGFWQEIAWTDLLNYNAAISDVTPILSQIESGDPSAAEQLLPLFYDELRQLAAAKLAQDKPEQTLQATALVHDAYLRLVDTEKPLHWNSRGHFFGAAAEAMRRILVDQARQKAQGKHRVSASSTGSPDRSWLASRPSGKTRGCRMNWRDTESTRKKSNTG